MMITPRQAVTATQTDTIRAHLMTGAPISTWEAYERYQITCLAQRVHELRRAGLDIKSEIMVKNGKRFSLYWIEEEERTRYVSGQVNTPADVRGTGSDTTNQDNDILASINEATKGHRASHEALAAVNANNGVWVPHDHIDNLLTALTLTAKSLNLLAQIADIEGAAGADKINDYSMDVMDIAMGLTTATSSARIKGIRLSHDYLKSLILSIDGQANGLGTMVTMATLTNTDMNEGVSEGISEVTMSLDEISANIEELMTLTEAIEIVEGSMGNDQ